MSSLLSVRENAASPSDMRARVSNALTYLAAVEPQQRITPSWLSRRLDIDVMELYDVVSDAVREGFLEYRMVARCTSCRLERNIRSAKDTLSMRCSRKDCPPWQKLVPYVTFAFGKNLAGNRSASGTFHDEFDRSPHAPDESSIASFPTTSSSTRR